MDNALQNVKEFENAILKFKQVISDLEFKVNQQEKKNLANERKLQQLETWIKNLRN